MASVIYIFSLPRSGSTLLQRIIGGSGLVYTRDEPWLVLRLLYPWFGKIYAEYGDLDASKALGDFFEDDEQEVFYRELCGFITNYYKSITPCDKKYFLEKTPRNILVADELIKYSPLDTKFVILLRHPLSILSSMINTWGKGGWVFHKYRVDLIQGMDILVELAKKTDGNLTVVKYEDLVCDPDFESKKLSGFLDVTINPYDFINTKLDGVMGDPKRSDFSAIKASNYDFSELSKNPFRLWLVIRYWKYIGKARVEQLGYDYEGTIDLLVSSKGFDVLSLVKDFINVLIGFVYNNMQPRVLWDSFKTIWSGDGYIKR